MDICDLLVAPVDVIVNPANCGLSHQGGLAAQIQLAAGARLEKQSNQLIFEYKQIDSGMAVFTDAGQLPYKAIIHAVGPAMGEGEEQHKIEQAVLRSLLLCEINNWSSIAFPAISAGYFNVPIETCAQALFRAITHFWDARHECVVEKIVLCLTARNYPLFVDAFHDDVNYQETIPVSANKEVDSVVGQIELTDDDIADLDNDELDDWFVK